jgi:hypothetical protein
MPTEIKRSGLLYGRQELKTETCAVWKDRNSAGANASELTDGINAKKQKPAISIFLASVAAFNVFLIALRGTDDTMANRRRQIHDPVARTRRLTFPMS